MNTLAQAEVRRNRLKNNTTRLSPAPDRAICNCWHKRKLAGYPTVLIQLRVRIGIQPFSDLNHRLFEDATTAFAVPASKRIPHYDSFYTASTSATTEPSDISAHILSTGKNKPVSKLLASQINECVIFSHDYV
jgi:hypothetical protein